MAGISLGGVNLDVSGIVSQLMALEARPLNKLQEQKTNYNSQLSELGRLKSALSKFQSSMESLSSLDKFEQYSFSSSESDTDKTYTATLDKDATAGIFSIDVQALATVNKFGSTTGFASDSTAITTSSNLVIDDGTDNFSIDVNGKTLTEIRDAINSAASSGDVGVSASIIKESDTKYQLVLTAKDTGLANAIQVSGAAELDLSEKQSAQDASVVIDGSYTISSATNKVEGAISGVTLDLNKVNTSGTAATFTISRDIDAVKSSVNSFISSYNSLMSSIKIYETGALKGDSFLNSIKNSVKNQLNSSSGTGVYNYLAEIGVTSNAKTGALELDSDVLNSAISNDYEAVSKLFAEKDKGVAYRLDSIIDEYISYSGLIKGKEDAINSRLRTNSKAQDSMLARLELKETAFLKQFSALDSLIGKMNSTSSSLTSMLASLPGFTR